MSRVLDALAWPRRAWTASVWSSSHRCASTLRSKCSGVFAAVGIAVAGTPAPVGSFLDARHVASVLRASVVLSPTAPASLGWASPSWAGRPPRVKHRTAVKIATLMLQPRLDVGLPIAEVSADLDGRRPLTPVAPCVQRRPGNAEVSRELGCRQEWGSCGGCRFVGGSAHTHGRWSDALGRDTASAESRPASSTPTRRRLAAVTPTAPVDPQMNGTDLLRCAEGAPS